MGAQIARRKNRVSNTIEPRRAVSQISVEASGKARSRSWLTSTFGLGLLGSLLVYASLPPLDWWPLAWIAPAPWLLLVRQNNLSGRRPYRALWVAGFVLWLGAIHWLRLPHWTTYFGWLALSFYLAFYVPVFVGLSRIAVHRLRWPVVVAAPIVWTGLELARGHLLSGFTMGSLAHTQIHLLPIIQAADIVGCYGISGLIVLVAACVARMIPWRGQPMAFWPVLPLVAAISAMFWYGQFRMDGNYTRPGPTVALIQGSIDVEVKTDEKHLNEVFEEYFNLSRQALVQQPNLDLLVWPETMFRFPLFYFADDFHPPNDRAVELQKMFHTSRKNLQDLQDLFRRIVDEKYQSPLPPPLLLGLDAIYLAGGGNREVDEQHFNSAVFVNSQGEALSRYDKMHPVMFGEYIPFAEYLPFLYRITPLTGGLTAGTHAVGQKLGPYRFAPNICYETVIPHLIRRQIIELREQGNEPDVMVNITNDGWFRGSSELDMHLACGVFRAIEMRKPLVISANTGFSAAIDGNGRILQQAPRRKSDVLIAKIDVDTRHSWYLDHGDMISGICLAGCLGLAGVGLFDRFRKRNKAAK
jgi:apolipoprotein N-acyltransferase